jgi:hypothetical protein
MTQLSVLYIGPHPGVKLKIIGVLRLGWFQAPKNKTHYIFKYLRGNPGLGVIDPDDPF